jgi:monoamine oxidase
MEAFHPRGVTDAEAVVYSQANPSTSLIVMRIAIIGGGPGGLLTAYLLRQGVAAPLDVTLFESTDRLGGKVVTARFETAPVPYEAGAAELYDYSLIGPDPLRELIRDLGLSTKPLHGKTVVMDGQILRTSDDIGRHLGPGALAALEDFRRLARQLISPADYYESDWRQHNEDPLAIQRLHQLLETVPNRAARRYLSVLVHSDLATEPHQTSALYGLHNFLMNEPDYMRLYIIEDGIEALTRELARRIRQRVLLRHRVSRVEPMGKGAYRVLARHEGKTVEDQFDAVIVALPNNWIPSIEWCGTLAEPMAVHHARYDHPAHYLRVSLLFERPFWRDQVNESYFILDAFGGCCVYDETSRTSETFWNGEAGGPFGVLGWLLAGEAALSLSNLADCDLIDLMLDSLPWENAREMLLEGRVHRWVGSVNGLPSGYPALEPELRHVPDGERNPRVLVVGDYLFDSTLNGVFDSAELAVATMVDLSGQPQVGIVDSGAVSHAAR